MCPEVSGKVWEGTRRVPELPGARFWFRPIFGYEEGPRVRKLLRSETEDKGGYGTMRRRLFSVPPPGQILSSLLSLARADTHTRPTTHIHLSVLPHGGCRPDLRPKRGAFWLFSRLPGGRATWLPWGKIVRQRHSYGCLLYTSPSPRDRQKSRMPSSA